MAVGLRAQRNQFLFIWKNVSDPRFLMEHLLRLPYYLIKYPGPVIQAIRYLPQALSKRQTAKKSWTRPDRDILSLWSR